MSHFYLLTLLPLVIVFAQQESTDQGGGGLSQSQTLEIRLDSCMAERDEQGRLLILALSGDERFAEEGRRWWNELPPLESLAPFEEPLFEPFDRIGTLQDGENGDDELNDTSSSTTTAECWLQVKLDFRVPDTPPRMMSSWACADGSTRTGDRRLSNSGLQEIAVRQLQQWIRPAAVPVNSTPPSPSPVSCRICNTSPNVQPRPPRRQQTGGGGYGGGGGATTGNRGRPIYGAQPTYNSYNSNRRERNPMTDGAAYSPSFERQPRIDWTIAYRRGVAGRWVWRPLWIQTTMPDAMYQQRQQRGQNSYGQRFNNRRANRSWQRNRPMPATNQQDFDFRAGSRGARLYPANADATGNGNLYAERGRGTSRFPLSTTNERPLAARPTSEEEVAGASVLLHDKQGG